MIDAAMFVHISRRWLHGALALCALVLSLWQFGTGAVIAAKAVLAQTLLEHAWQQSLLAPQQPHKPWPWADTWPVLRLQWRAQNTWQSTYVLASAAGASLAFGPGLLDGSALPGAGTTVLAAHRDTHFRMLATASVGDLLRLQNARGEWFAYRIIAKKIVDSRSTPLLLDPDTDELILVTCYPFDAFAAGGPLRLLVEALPLID